MQKQPQLIAKFLGGKNAKSKSLIAEAKLMSQIKIIIDQSLDYQIAEHTYVSNIKNGQLTLVVDAAVWAIRLRYMQDAIINSLKNFTMAKNINRIEVKVRPLALRRQKIDRPVKKLTISQSSALRMKAELEVISDPTIRASLTKILRHAKRTNK